MNTSDMQARRERDDELSLVRVATFLLRYRWLLIGLPLAAMVITAAFNMQRPRMYTSTATFTPQSSNAGAAELMGLATQFGISLGSAANPNESPAFYATLVRSRAILGPVSQMRFTAEIDGEVRTGTIAQLYELKARSPAHLQEKAWRELAKAVSASVARETGVVMLGVEARSPNLAKQFTDSILSLVNTFNVQQRQSQARAEREFVEARLAEVERELLRAENRLEEFLKRNRRYESSPDLLFERERLDRAVQAQQQLRLSLQQSNEQARIEEVRDLPVITVIEQPNVPVRGDSRRTVGRGVTMGIAFFVLALLIAFIRQIMRDASHDARGSYAQFDDLRRRFTWELRHPLRALRGRGR
jgi:uncharacterized protein involved in exopolysaccharide biosynthesis